MTIADIERAATEFCFVGGLSMWSAKVYVVRDIGIANLWGEFFIPDSTDPSRMQALRTNQALEIEALSNEKRTPEQFIVDFLARFFLHEMFESILVRGERLFDPHEARAYHPGAI